MLLVTIFTMSVVSIFAYRLVQIYLLFVIFPSTTFLPKAKKQKDG